MRMMPALFGCLLVPVVYQLIVELNLTRWTAVLASCLIIFGRYMLLRVMSRQRETFMCCFVL